MVGSPAVTGGVVDVGSGDGTLYAIDRATGALRWRYDGGSAIASSPAVAGGNVFVGSADGRVYDFDRRTGKLLWSFRTASQVYGSPVPSGDEVIFGSTDGSVYALGISSTPVHRAVFFDSAYLKSAGVDDPPALSLYLEHRGYQRLGAAGGARTPFAADRRGGGPRTGAEKAFERPVQSGRSERVIRVRSAGIRAIRVSRSGMMPAGRRASRTASRSQPERPRADRLVCYGADPGRPIRVIDASRRPTRPS